MASLTIPTDSGEFIEVLDDLRDAVLSCKKLLPDHVRERLYIVMNNSRLAADIEMDGGIITIRPSGELLSVLALCRGHARAT